MKTQHLKFNLTSEHSPMTLLIPIAFGFRNQVRRELSARDVVVVVGPGLPEVRPLRPPRDMDLGQRDREIRLRQERKVNSKKVYDVGLYRILTLPDIRPITLPDTGYPAK